MKKIPATISKSFFWLIIIVVLSLPPVAMAVIPDAPNPPALVNDFAGLLSSDQQLNLEKKLVDYANTYGTQIAIVTIRDIPGMAISDFADQLAEKWGIGQAGRENGLLILVNPGQGNERGRVHISVGYGLEGIIPDITAKQIIDREIVPNFREGHFYEGLDQATTILMQLAAGEFPAEDYNKSEEPSVIAIAIFVFLIFLFVALLSRKRNAYASPGKEIPLWTLLWLMSHGNKGNKGSWGDFTSGRGSFGSGGFGRGGGFGGFGGGRFGGGGAGGSW